MRAVEKHLVISGVCFPYGQEQFEESLAANRALSYRFLPDGKGWRVFVSSEGSPGKPISERRLGAIGIDNNLKQLVLAHFIGGERIGCVTYGKTQAQAKAIMGDAVKQAIAAAIRSHKPIVVERLEFAEKKATRENEGSGRARMLSSFAYQQTLQYLKAAGFRAGVEVIPVDSAYTSTIGAVNYAARLGISIHQGAAIAIAGRSLGLSERPAVRVARCCKESEQTCVVVLVEGVPADSSGACSAGSVASRNTGKYTCVSLSPDAVCYLNSAWCNPARESFPIAVRETLWHKMPYLRNG